jgi:hypothetical protein
VREPPFPQGGNDHERDRVLSVIIIEIRIRYVIVIDPGAYDIKWSAFSTLLIEQETDNGALIT